MPYTIKKHIPRVTGIPMEFPLKCYKPAPNDIPADAPEILVGMDSGISNTAFSCIEVIRDTATNIPIDFKYIGTYYFKDELEEFSCKLDRQIYLVEQYYNLFSHKKVSGLTFEVLSLNCTKDAVKLSGIIDAQATTTLISTIAYQLGHHYNPAPAPAIKRCLTGSGTASKEDMCREAFALTKDEELLHNDHMADAFACCFYTFMKEMKEKCDFYNIPIPQKFSCRLAS